jgi:hypothetical protein
MLFSLVPLLWPLLVSKLNLVESTVSICSSIFTLLILNRLIGRQETIKVLREKSTDFSQKKFRFNLYSASWLYFIVKSSLQFEELDLINSAPHVKFLLLVAFFTCIFDFFVRNAQHFLIFDAFSGRSNRDKPKVPGHLMNFPISTVKLVTIVFFIAITFLAIRLV